MNESILHPVSDIVAIRERNRAELKHLSAVENTMERLEVFSIKVLIALEHGVPLNNKILREEAEAIVNANIGIMREVAH